MVNPINHPHHSYVGFLTNPNFGRSMALGFPDYMLFVMLVSLMIIPKHGKMGDGAS